MYSTVCGTAVEYDNAGNLTRDHRGCRYVYDYENKITRIFIDENANGVHDAGVDANIVEFTYDALGWRIERTNPSGTALRYYYDGQRVVLRTNVDSGGVESDSRSFVFGNYIDEVLMMCPLGLEFYYAHDHLYSPVVLFNSSGGIDERYEYDAYGKRSMYSGTWAPRTSSPMGNFYAFTGRELDYLDGGNLQIMYYRARYYDPETGRFMQRDSLGINPAGGFNGIYDPVFQYSDSEDLYCYAINNPIRWLDKFGEAVSEVTCNLGIADAKSSPEGSKLLKDLKNARRLTRDGRQKRCTVPKFLCRCCKHAAYFQGYNYRIHVCTNNLNSQKQVKESVIHELTHAWDHCKGTDFSDCEEHACSEVRANKHSGGCDLGGIYRKPGESKKDCARRVAVISVQANRKCVSTATSDVNAIFDQCWKDDEPF